MLSRLILKLLFKACVPLVAVVGIMSYGLYMKGGDPAGLWRHVASGAIDKASGMFSDVTKRTAGMAGGVVGNFSGGESSDGNSSSTQVFTWKDSDGVTHFGTSAPDGIDVQTVRIDPNVNVLAPVYERVSVSQNESDRAGFPAIQGTDRQNGRALPESSTSSRDSSRERTRQSVEQLEAELGEPLPGVAGQLLSGGGAEGGLNADQLIRLLQSAQ